MEGRKICGLVGTFGYITGKEASFFKDAMTANSVRGFHSTGVASLYKHKEEIGSWYHKDAITGAQAAVDETFKTVYEDKTNLAIIGHNRWATTGAVNEANAHPFVHGSIVLMHNGTLLDTDDLQGNFDTDSEHIAYTMSKNSNIKEVLESIDGAYALVWFDTDKSTLNFARNNERPLHMASNRSGDLVYYASEEKMLDWCMDRNKIYPGNGGITSLPVGEWWEYDISEVARNKRLEPRIVKFKPKESYYGYYSTYPKSNAVVPRDSAGIVTGDVIKFEVEAMHQTSWSRTSVDITGSFTKGNRKYAVKGYSIPEERLAGVSTGDYVTAEASTYNHGIVYLKRDVTFVLVSGHDDISDTAKCDSCYRYVESDQLEVWGNYAMCQGCLYDQQIITNA